MKTAKTAFRWLLGYVAPYRGFFALNVACLIVNSAIAIGTAYFIQRLVQAAVDGRSPTDLSTSIEFLAGLAAVGVGATFLAAYTNGKYGNGALRDLKAALAIHVRDMTVAELDASHSGDLASRLNNDIGQIQTFVKNHIAKIIYLPIMGAAAASYMIARQPLLFVACFALTPISLFFPITSANASTACRARSRTTWVKPVAWNKTSSVESR